jgi:hypothetical protein
MKGTKYFNNSRHPVLMAADEATFMAKKRETMTKTGGNPVADSATRPQNSTQPT